MSRNFFIPIKATKGIYDYLIRLTAFAIINWSSGICEANAQSAPLPLTVTIRLVDAETDTTVVHANVSATDEKTGQSVAILPDSLGFKLSALPGTTTLIRASAPAYLPARTRIPNLAMSQRVIMKLMHTKPSVLTIKAFDKDISQPLSPAIAIITSRITGKTEQFTLKNGRLERRFTQPDKVDVQVSSPGYSSASRQLTIDVPPLGNRYEFDAELDKITVRLTIRAVDSQTNEAILGGRFMLTSAVGTTPILLKPSPTIGQSSAILPDMGTYQLLSSAEGYEDVTRSLVVDKEKSEVLIKLVARLPTAESRPMVAVTSAKPAGLKMSATSIPVLAKGAVTTKTFGVIEKGRSIRLNKIYFDQSSPVLRPESYPELDQLYDVLMQYPSLRIEIHGHTDNQGDFDLNTQLSRNRCQAVIEYLAGKGIRKNRLKAVGRGPLDPVAPNNNEENRKKNRRVEFVLL